MKRVMQFATYAAYHARLESAFLADEIASALAAASGLDRSAAEVVDTRTLLEETPSGPPALAGPTGLEVVLENEVFAAGPRDALPEEVAEPAVATGGDWGMVYGFVGLVY